MSRYLAQAARLQPVLLAVAACIGLVVFTFWGHHRERELEIRETKASTANIARLVEEYARQTFRRLELTLSDVRVVVASVTLHQSPASPSPNEWLQRYLPADGLVSGLVLTDASGAVSASTLAADDSLGAAIGTREWFGWHQVTPELRMFVGRPERDRSSRWVVPFTMRVSAPDGSFAGVLVAVVSASSFQSVLESVEFGSSGFVSMHLVNGTLLATAPANDALRSRDWAGTPLFRDYIANSPIDSVRETTEAQGAERVYSYRVMPDFPLVVAAGVSMHEVLARWRATLLRSLGLVLAVSAALLLASLTLVRHYARIEEAEQALNRSVEQTRAILNHAADGIVTVDARGRVESANLAAQAMFMRTESELVGCEFGSLVPLYGRIPVPESGDAGLEVKPRVRRETHGVRSDASQFPIEVVITMTPGVARASRVAVIRDLTEQREAATRVAELAEERMRRSASELADKAKGEFLSRVSHELRTPLNAVNGFAQILEEGQALEPQVVADYAGHIRAAGRHLLLLVDDLLELNRINQGAVRLTPERIDLRQIIDESALMLGESACAAGVRIEIDGSHGLFGWVDPGRLRQVLLNLGSNAIKYNRAGGRVVFSAQYVHARRIRVSVADNGIGMDRQQLSRLFQPFDRLGLERTAIPGTGLGLSITRNLLIEMGAPMNIQSDPGRGTTVSFELNAADEIQAGGGAGGANGMSRSK